MTKKDKAKQSADRAGQPAERLKQSAYLITSEGAVVPKTQLQRGTGTPNSKKERLKDVRYQESRHLTLMESCQERDSH